jgi:CheY-like chemotaxis protein
MWIIDDDPIYVFTVSQAIAIGGFQMETEVFGDGLQAIDAMRQVKSGSRKAPDIVLIDLNMPIWDGWDFMEEFANLQCDLNTAFYVVSSSDHPDDVRRAENFSFVKKFILKPITIEKLQGIDQ